MTAQIKISELRKKYPNGTEALKGINLEIQKGSFFTLLGPNGAGKSTLIKILTTLISKDAGSFTIAGIQPEKNFTEIQFIIGVASQENEIDPALTVEELLIFQCCLFGMKKIEAKDRSRELIAHFALESVQNKKSSELSGGNKRRLHCALALVHRPQILFLDEPTVGMDPLSRENFWQIITDLNKSKEITVFLTTQYLEEADKYATEMALIIEGEIKYTGSIQNFKHRVGSQEAFSLEESYLHYIKSITLKNNCK